MTANILGNDAARDGLVEYWGVAIRKNLVKVVVGHGQWAPDRDAARVVVDDKESELCSSLQIRMAQHGLLRTMRDVTTWFCDAYASWQKGGIENANGRLRRWLPRHLDIDRTSDQDIQEIVLTTNLTPRKCLGFKTPFQALLAELGKDLQIRFS